MNSGFLVLILLLVLVMWLLMIRPQRRRQQAQQAMLDDLRAGDEVITAGGFYATVERIDDDEVTVELSPGTRARVSKRAIAAVVPPDVEEPEEIEEADEEPEDEEAEAGAEPTRRARR